MLPILLGPVLVSIALIFTLSRIVNRSICSPYLCIVPRSSYIYKKKKKTHTPTFHCRRSIDFFFRGVLGSGIPPLLLQTSQHNDSYYILGQKKNILVILE